MKTLSQGHTANKRWCLDLNSHPKLQSSSSSKRNIFLHVGASLTATEIEEEVFQGGGASWRLLKSQLSIYKLNLGVEKELIF